MKTSKGWQTSEFWVMIGNVFAIGFGVPVNEISAGISALYIFGIRKHSPAEQLAVVTRRVEFVWLLLRSCWLDPYVDVKIRVSYSALASQHAARDCTHDMCI